MELDIVKEIKTIIAEILHKKNAQVTDKDLKSLDSMGRITLIVGLENRFQIELMTETIDFVNLDSLHKFSDYIMKKINV